MKLNCAFLAGSLLALTAVGLSGCGENNPLAPDLRGPNEIWIQNSAFIPERLTVNVGTAVKWVNKDGLSHTVDSGSAKNPTNLFNSPVLEKRNMSFTWTFETKGTFSYYCSIHPSQVGQVIVQ